jgi:hemoglobin
VRDIISDGADKMTQEKAHINEETIHQMVHQFYDEVREDPCLGPIFERRLHGQWPEHLARMCDFWSGVLLASGRFQGNPRETHSTLSNSGVRPAHFERWLYLFKGVVGRIFTEEEARDIYQRAERMRHVLEPVTVKPAFA